MHPLPKILKVRRLEDEELNQSDHLFMILCTRSSDAVVYPMASICELLYHI